MYTYCTCTCTSLSLFPVGPIPTQQQKTTALIILGMIGAEFHEVTESKKRSAHDPHRGGRRGHVTEHEVMDQAIARQTAKALQVIIYE